MADIVAFHSLARSNMPHEHKRSLLGDWHSKLMGSHQYGARIKAHGVESLQVLRTGGESVIAGGLFGLLHANLKNGLDVQLKAPDASGKGGIHVPVDAALGVIGMFGAVALANHGHYGPSCDARNLAASGLSVFAFRKTMDVIAAKKAQSGQAMGGTVGIVKGAAHAGDFGAEDPILAAARALG